MNNLNNITRKEKILPFIIIYGFVCIVFFIATLPNILNHVGSRWLIAVLEALHFLGVFILSSSIISIAAVAFLVKDDNRTFLMRFEASKTSKEDREKIRSYVQSRLPIGSTLIVLPNDISLTEINPPSEDRLHLEDVKNLLLQDAEKLRKLGEREK